jgi:glycosyltransferase involved in cell wall biosynthesis
MLEVIVVDQESEDGTPEVAVEFGVRLAQCSRPTGYAPPTASRNLGAGLSGGMYLLHLDADMTVPPGGIARAVRQCSEAGNVAVVLEEVDMTEGYWGRCKALERRAYRDSELIEGARFVRADVFALVGGYDETLGSGEDWDIHARYARRGSIGRLGGAVHHHLGQISYPAQVRKKFEYGRSAQAFLVKHDSSGYWRLMLASYWRSRREFAGDPVHAAGFAALRLGEVAALCAGLAVEFLARRRFTRHL